MFNPMISIVKKPTLMSILTKILNSKTGAILILLLVLIASCSPWSSETRQALKMAGDNRAELEKVLEYYHKVNPDPLKLKAAEYLISNMLYQYSRFGAGVDSLNESYKYVYGIYIKDRNSVLMSDSVYGKRTARIDVEFDLKRISSNYLITQIESAFETYNRHEWSKMYPFEIFCEYILPYKIGHSDTAYWRSFAYEKYGPLLDYAAFKGSTSHYEAEKYGKIDLLIVKVEGASGNATRKLGKDSLQMFELDFHTNSKGYQLFNIHYINGHSTGATIRVMVDDLIIGDFIFPSTGKWHKVDKDVPPVDFTALLDAGKHTLKMIALDKSILLDFIYLPEYIFMKFPESVITEGTYFFSNSFGRITIAEDSLINENNISIYPDPLKEWPIKIVAKDDNLYQLLFEDSGLVKAIDAFPFGESEWLITYNDHGFQNQLWSFIPLESGGYQIRNKETGRILAFSEKDSILVQLPVELMRDEFAWHLKKAGLQDGNDKGDSFDLSIRAAQKISEITNRFHWSGSYVEIGPVDLTKVLEYTYGSCVEETNFQTMVLRSMGVACAVDFVFNYPERNAGHSWSVVFDLEGNAVQNNCHNPVGAGTWVDVFAKGKVYRNTNAINRNSLLFKNKGKEPIPGQFMNPYFIDVTKEYCQVRDFEVSIAADKQTGNIFAYLMVFNNDRWVVTAWGETTRRGTAEFKDVEPRGMYLPAFYVNGSFKALNDPFYFDSIGNINHIEVSKGVMQDITLKRKFPNRQVDESYHKLIIGGKFQGANRADFSDAVTIGTITQDMTEPVFHRINVDLKETFKYLRYIGPDGGRCNINEMVFFDAEGDIIKGKIIGTEGSFENSGKTKEMVFDGDVLTYFDAPDLSGNWVGLHLPHPTSVSKILFVTRNDGNMVEKGDEYELAYWGDQDWVSMGKQIAATDSLIYKDVPMGGLYWLQNHTKGWEERIFTLDSLYHQVWW
jgi:hypothetical protein